MTDPLRYVIVIEQANDGGYGAWAPDLPGCVALADTIEETVREMCEAIAFHLEGLREYGEPIPQPSAITAAIVEVDAARGPGPDARQDRDQTTSGSSSRRWHSPASP